MAVWGAVISGIATLASALINNSGSKKSAVDTDTDTDTNTNTNTGGGGGSGVGSALLTGALQLGGSIAKRKLADANSPASVDPDVSESKQHVLRKIRSLDQFDSAQRSDALKLGIEGTNRISRSGRMSQTSLNLLGKGVNRNLLALQTNRMNKEIALEGMRDKIVTSQSQRKADTSMLKHLEHKAEGEQYTKSWRDNFMSALSKLGDEEDDGSIDDATFQAELERRRKALELESK